MKKIKNRIVDDFWHLCNSITPYLTNYHGAGLSLNYQVETCIHSDFSRCCHLESSGDCSLNQKRQVTCIVNSPSSIAFHNFCWNSRMLETTLGHLLLGDQVIVVSKNSIGISWIWPQMVGSNARTPLSCAHAENRKGIQGSEGESAEIRCWWVDGNQRSNSSDNHAPRIDFANYKLSLGLWTRPKWEKKWNIIINHERTHGEEVEM